jgi:hypothetical protein
MARRIAIASVQGGDKGSCERQVGRLQLRICVNELDGDIALALVKVHDALQRESRPKEHRRCPKRPVHEPVDHQPDEWHVER